MILTTYWKIGWRASLDRYALPPKVLRTPCHQETHSSKVCTQDMDPNGECKREETPQTVAASDQYYVAVCEIEFIGT